MQEAQQSTTLMPVSMANDQHYLTLTNGYLLLQFDMQQRYLAVLRADFHGRGDYGSNLLASEGTAQGRGGIVLECSAQVLPPESEPAALEVRTLQESSSLVQVQIANVSAHPATSAISSTWTLTLKQGERFFQLDTTTTTLTAQTLTGIQLSGYFTPRSSYGLFERGVVQRLDSKQPYFASTDAVRHCYFLGETGCIDIEPQGQQQLVLLNTAQDSGAPGYRSGIQLVLNGSYPELDVWSVQGWREAESIHIQAHEQRTVSMRIGANNYDFPVLQLPDDHETPFNELRTFYTAIYGTCVGSLVSYQTPGQVAPTLAFPERSYGELYTFFDPDAWLVVCTLLYAGDPYLQNEARKLIETAGAAMLPTGQLPHHFDDREPIYVAISGATQTGPNIFWIAAVLQYARVSGDFAWLRAYMPLLKRAITFLTERFDASVQLIDAPGPLWIDVFIRTGFTSDTNAFMVYLLREIADAEEFFGEPELAVQRREMAATIAASINERLWSEDHYVTQLNRDGTIRDLVDYDANLLAVAFGIAPLERIDKLLARLERGLSKQSRPTYVSEVYYDTQDTYNGNTGDSAITMGRIGWAEGYACAVIGDRERFLSRIIEPIRSDLFNTTWLYERYDSQGTPEHNPFYHEYPEMLVMLLREIAYGISMQWDSIVIRPFTDTTFYYHIGNVRVAYTPEHVELAFPLADRRRMELHSLLPNTAYLVTSEGKSQTSNSDEVGTLHIDDISPRAVTVTRK